MSIEQQEILDLLKQLCEATGNMAEQADILDRKLREAYADGVSNGLALARMSAVSETVMPVSPNSFAASCAKDDNIDNSDDLYVNA